MKIEKVVALNRALPTLRRYPFCAEYLIFSACGLHGFGDLVHHPPHTVCSARMPGFGFYDDPEQVEASLDRIEGSICEIATEGVDLSGGFNDTHFTVDFTVGDTTLKRKTYPIDENWYTDLDP